MNATTLRDRIMEPIAAIWEKADDKEVDLTVAQLRELENQVRVILWEARKHVCVHIDLAENGWCWSCGSFTPHERKSA